MTSEEDAEGPSKPMDRAAKKVAKAPNKRAMAVKVSCFTTANQGGLINVAISVNAPAIAVLKSLNEVIKRTPINDANKTYSMMVAPFWRLAAAAQYMRVLKKLNFFIGFPFVVNAKTINSSKLANSHLIYQKRQASACF